MSTETDTSNRIVAGSNYDHGEPRTWEITWINGHTEKVKGHKAASMPSHFADHDELRRPPSAHSGRVEIHGVVHGRWELIFSGRSEEITAVQLITP